MMITILLALRRDDRGVALGAVLGMGLVLTALLATGLMLSTSGARKSATDRDAGNAMAAAFAGLADYQSRMTTDNQYWNYGSPTAFSGSSAFSGTKSNPAFGTTAGGTWAAVPNSFDQSYRYEVDNSNFSAMGVLRVRVTGRTGTTTKSIVATLKGTGFIDYLYFTDYESSNPAITGENQAADSSKACLSKHVTEADYNATTACRQVQFIQGDILRGPVRSNDKFYICGATFQRQVQSTAPNGSYTKPSGCTKDAVFQQVSSSNPQPENVQTFDLPKTNSKMIQETRYDLAGVIPGCLYTGPTSVVFTQESGVGYMTVRSPWTKATQIAIASNGKMSGRSGGDAATQCGSISALQSATGAKVKVPANNLVYVQSVPSSAANVNDDPNWWSPGTIPTSPSGATFCQVTVPGYWSYVGGRWVWTPPTNTYGNGLTNAREGLAYPAAGENTGAVGDGYFYGCRNGDAFVEGKFDGALTVGAQNFVYVTGDIKYASTTGDILGLVGQSAVNVWNPVSCSSTDGDGNCSTSKNATMLLAKSGGESLEIDAAIASNAGTFQVQNYKYGAQLGTLTVKGSIAQEWRGAVGVTYTFTSGGHTSSFQTGYTKDYGYDERLKSTSPPKFLQPVQTTYGITTQVEVKSAYTAAGAVIP